MCPGPANPAPEYIEFAPALDSADWLRLWSLLDGTLSIGMADAVNALRREASISLNRHASPYLRATCLVLADLLERGWGARTCATPSPQLQIYRPGGVPPIDESVLDAKARIRAFHLVGRNRQLRQPPVQEFIRRMERPRRHNGCLVSVLDLIDRGNELTAAFSSVEALPEAERDKALAAVVEPRLQICDEGARCEATGLRLKDIWRYFRYTWSLEYRSLAGRSMQFLIRNTARPMAPVIGIAMLASPPAGLVPRDDWLGLRVDALKGRLERSEWSADEVGRALVRALDEAIDVVRRDDLGIGARDVREPGPEVLQQLLARAREGNDQEPAAERSLPTRPDGSIDWTTASAGPFFVRKRARILHRLLKARLEFNRYSANTMPADAVRAMLRTSGGRSATSIALAEIRKRVISSQLMDVSVCGAIPPYSDLLGGKLVALMLASDEVRRAYAARYGEYESIIASQMAGRPVHREPDLVVLTTTSLYRVGSSQYNRLSLRAADHPELPHDVKWVKIGTELQGLGTTHFSTATLQALQQAEFARARQQGRRAAPIRHGFGEGTSAVLRKARAGLDAIGLNSDELLRHGAPRLLYVCEVMPQAGRRLLGLAAEPTGTPSQAALSAAWRRRWLARRVRDPEVLARVERQSAATIHDRLSPDTAVQPRLPAFS